MISFSMCLPGEVLNVVSSQRRLSNTSSRRANRADVEALRSCAPFVREVGDCVRPANITKAIYEAYHAALDI